jgi:hypothetical protein
MRALLAAAACLALAVTGSVATLVVLAGVALVRGRLEPPEEPLDQAEIDAEFADIAARYDEVGGEL